MPVLEVEVGDDGAIKTLPEPLQKFFDKRIDEAYRKGADKTERALSPLTVDPVEMERLRQRDKLLADVELKEAERTKEYEKARKLHEEAAEKAKADAVKAEKANTAKAIEKVRAAVTKSIRSAALAHGARAESLDELERLLAADIDLDDELNEYVVDAKDRKAPRVGADGQPVSIEGLVADYLKTHPHHVKAEATKSSGARGGATLAGKPPIAAGGGTARERALARMADEPSTRNVDALMSTLGQSA